MYKDHTVGVVVPAYNEEGFVGTVIDTIPPYVDRVYVIDDCSTDRTWTEIQRHAEKQNRTAGQPAVDSVTITSDGGTAFERRVVPIQHDENRGVGGAIKTGYLHALEDEIDVTAVMGGDGQMDPDVLPRILDPVVEGSADYAKGNRLLDPEYRSAMPTWRVFGNSILTFLTKIASGYWKMMDPQEGYTAISRDALESVEIEEMYEYFGYCNDLLVKLNVNGMRIADVPRPAQYGDEESSITYPTYVRRVSVMLLRNFFWRLKVKHLVSDFHPLVLFYGFGAITAGLGAFAGLWSLYSRKGNENSLFVRTTLSLLVFVVGWMLLLFAMLLDMQVNEEYEVHVRDPD